MVVGSSPAPGTKLLSSVDRNRYLETDCKSVRLWQNDFPFLPGFITFPVSIETVTSLCLSHRFALTGVIGFAFLPGFPQCSSVGRARKNLFAFSPARVAIEWVT